MAAAVTVAALLAGCNPGTDQPEPYVTEGSDSTVVICAPIAAKDDSHPGRWAFRFDHDGGWTSVPVPRADFDRHQVGDWVGVWHRIGEVAEVYAERCAR
jgi:hypothetical protein